MHLPVRSEFGLIEEDEVDELDVLTLPRRMIYALFPNFDDQDAIEGIMHKIRLCLHVSEGPVAPLENSVGWIMAANLLNSMFESVFEVANITTREDRDDFLEALKTGEVALEQFFAGRVPLIEVS